MTTPSIGTDPPSTTGEHYESRQAELVAELSVRLRKACADMSESDFDQLVQAVAATTVKFEIKAEKPRRDAVNNALRRRK